MFENIGSKIKTLAKVVCWVGIIASLILALIMFISSSEASYSEEGTYTGLGFAFLIIGPLVSWIGSFFTYGFGELIERTQEIAQNTKPTVHTQNNQNFTASSAESTHKWKCDKCGNLVSQTPCEKCGYTPSKNKNDTLDELLKSGLITQAEYDEKRNQQ